MTRFLSIPILACTIVALAPAGAAAQAQADAALIQKARGIHDRVIALDTHDDIDPENFTRQKNYTQRLDTQVNLPKMKEGGLDASFFIVYVGQGPLTPEGYDSAYKQAIAKFDAVHHLTKEIAPDQIEMARELGAEIVELHTGAFANATGTEQKEELTRLRSAADFAHKLKLQVNAGHGINYTNIALIRTVPHLEELNIGHSIVSRAAFFGLEEAVRTMLAAMNE